MQSSEDLKFWQAVGGCVLSAASGLIGGAWVSRGVLESLRQADTALSIRVTNLEKQLEVLAAMSTNIAVLTVLQTEMQADIKAIFERLERRQMEVYPPPHGERREQ